MTHIKTVSVDVEVEVNMEDIDTIDLLEELETRSISGYQGPRDTGDLIEAMWRAFYTGKEARAMDLAREIAETATGRMVPQPQGARHGTAPQA